MLKKPLRLGAFVLVLLLGATPLFAQDAPEAKQPGLIDIDFGSAIWVLISFGLLVIILKKAAWKNVLDGLKAREQRIGGNIKQAEEVRAQAEALLKEHTAKMAGADEQIRQMLVKAGADAEKIAANVRAQAQADAEAERDKVRKEIDSAKRDAIRQVYEQTAELATTVASKIIGRNLNPQDQQDLVSQTLGQLESLQKN